MPVLKPGPKATEPAATRIDGAFYQLRRQEVQCRQNTAVVHLDPAHHVTWIRAVIFQSDAAHQVPSLSDVFAK